MGRKGGGSSALVLPTSSSAGDGQTQLPLEARLQRWPNPGRDKGAVTNPDTGTTIPRPDGGYLTRLDFADLKISEHFTRGNDGTASSPRLWQADREKIQRMAPLEYIGRYMKGWWDYSIADELHQLAQETAQGNNLGVLYRCREEADRAHRHAHGRLRRRPLPSLLPDGSRGRWWPKASRRARLGKTGLRRTLWRARVHREDSRRRQRLHPRRRRATVRQVRKPGASPLVFGKFLMASTAFVTLEDIADYLPSYEESVIEVEMDAELGKRVCR